MPEPRSLLAHIRRRKIGHWALAYLAGSWLLLQALDVLTQNFDLPHRFFQMTLAVVVAGFLAVLVVAWYHGEKGSQRVGRVELVMLIEILLLGGIAVGFVATRPRRDANRAGDRASVEKASIAVLPFVDMSPNHDQGYFSDGLAEELLNVLAQVPALRVAARTSSFAFKDRNVEVDSIGRALRVAHVLEGSVRTSGPRVRITAQLIDARSGYHVWSETYDRDLQDIFALQVEIANAIAPQLQLRLGARSPAVATGLYQTRDPQAHALLLQGVHFARVGKREELAQAVDLLRRAVQRDPRYARAHAELGAAYQRQAYLRFLDPDDGYRMAETEAERALALDSTDYRAHELLGRIADYRRWDFRTAEREFGLALEANPSDATTHSHRAWMLMRLRRTGEALAEAQRASALDPISGGITSNLAAMYLYADRFDDAARTFEAAVALEPTDVASIANLAMAYAIAGRNADAVRTAQQAAAHAADDDFVSSVLAYACARAGRPQEADRVLRTLEARHDVSPYLLAGIHLARGDPDRALQLLETAVKIRDDFAGDIAVDPVFASLRSQPRFQRILRDGGLIQTGT